MYAGINNYTKLAKMNNLWCANSYAICYGNTQEDMCCILTKHKFPGIK